MPTSAETLNSGTRVVANAFRAYLDLVGTSNTSDEQEFLNAIKRCHSNLIAGNVPSWFGLLSTYDAMLGGIRDAAKMDPTLSKIQNHFELIRDLILEMAKIAARGNAKVALSVAHRTSL